MARDLILLHTRLVGISVAEFRGTYLLQGHAILDEQSYPRVQISYVLLKHEVLLRLRRNPRFQLPERFLCYATPSAPPHVRGVACTQYTSCQVILNLQILLFRGHGEVEGRHGVALGCPHGSGAIVGGHGVLARHGCEGGSGRGRGSRGSLKLRGRHGGGLVRSEPDTGVLRTRSGIDRYTDEVSRVAQGIEWRQRNLDDAQRCRRNSSRFSHTLLELCCKSRFC